MTADYVSELTVIRLELAMIEVEIAEITAAVKKMAGYLDADEVDS